MVVKNTVSALQRFGIESAPYKRAPFGKNVFAISIQPRSQRGVVTVNHGKAEVEITGSRKFKQAVVSITEHGRKVTRKVRTVIPATLNNAMPVKARQEEALRSKFPVVMPAMETVWTFAEIKLENGKRPVPGGGLPWIITGVVTARIANRTVNHLLIGMDETHHFISPLPKKAKSVREAHRMLRPDVKRNSIRTGEWFFEPCDKATCEMVDEAAKRILPHSITNRRAGHRGFRLGSTTHYAAVLVRAGKKQQLYARGDIIDGRQGHHALVFLPKWHRVVRNKEGTIKVHKDQRETMQRNRSTWD